MRKMLKYLIALAAVIAALSLIAAFVPKGNGDMEIDVSENDDIAAASAESAYDDVLAGSGEVLGTEECDDLEICMADTRESAESVSNEAAASDETPPDISDWENYVEWVRDKTFFHEDIDEIISSFGEIIEGYEIEREVFVNYDPLTYYGGIEFVRENGKQSHVYQGPDMWVFDDYSAHLPYATPVHAADDGTIVYSGYVGIFGRVIVADCGSYYIAYVNCAGDGSDLPEAKKVGEEVKQGDIVAYVGDSATVDYELRLYVWLK